MFKLTALATVVACGTATSAYARTTIPLSNLFDDAKGSSLATAMGTDTYKAGAQTTDLGVVQVLSGGLGGNVLIAPGITFNTASAGGANTTGVSAPANDTVRANNSTAISTLGTLLATVEVTRQEDGIGVWADQLLTFDLDELRTAGGMPSNTPFQFFSRAGINDFASSSASLKLAVIISDASGPIAAYLSSPGGNAVSVSTLFSGGAFTFIGVQPAALTGAAGQRISIFDHLAVPGNAKFLTLASFSQGDGTASDHGVFGQAQLIENKVPTPGGITLAGFGLALMIGARRRGR